MHDIMKNVWKLYALRFLEEFWLVGPILVPFYLDNGLSQTQVFVVQAIYMAVILLFEIPSGYLSDVIGRKRTFIMSGVLFPMGLTVYAISHGFWGFVLAETILGIAVSLSSGTDSAIMYDTLKQAGKESDYKRVEGWSQFHTHLGDGISAVLGGLFATIALRLPFYLDIGVSIILFCFTLSLVEPSRTQPKGKESPMRRMLQTTRYSFTHPQIRSLILFFALLLSTNLIGIWSYYLYYGNAGLDVAVYGVLFAAFSACSAAGAKFAERIEAKLGKQRALYLLLLPAIMFTSLGTTTSIFLIPLIFVNGFIAGMSMPLFKDYVNTLIGSDVRATILSVASMAGSVGFIILSPLFGKISDIFTLSAAYVSLGVIYALVAATSLMLLHRHRVI